MASYLLQTCGCPADVPCSCGIDGANREQIRQMRKLAQRTMQHIATFYSPGYSVDERSGQHLRDPLEVMEICLGLKEEGNGQQVQDAEATYQRLYRLRLPHWMAGLAKPQSEYEVTCAYGLPIPQPLRLTQIGTPNVGASAVNVLAGSKEV